MQATENKAFCLSCEAVKLIYHFLCKKNLEIYNNKEQHSTWSRIEFLINWSTFDGVTLWRPYTVLLIQAKQKDKHHLRNHTKTKFSGDLLAKYCMELHDPYPAKNTNGSENVMSSTLQMCDSLALFLAVSQLLDLGSTAASQYDYHIDGWGTSNACRTSL